MAAILLWSSTIAVGRSLTESLGAFGAGAAACGFSGLMAGLFSLRHRSQRRQILNLPRRYLLGCGSLFALYTGLLYLAVGASVSREQTLVVGLINYLWPVLTLLLSLPLLGRRARWTLWPGTVLAFAGIALVMIPLKQFSWKGVVRAAGTKPIVFVMAALAAVSWALYSNLTRRWASGSHQGGTALFMVGTALMMGFLALVNPEPRHVDLAVFLEALFLGLATFVGYSLWDRAMRLGRLTLVTVFSYMTPLFSSLVSALYLGVSPGLELWLGCLLLILGSFLSWKSVSGDLLSGKIC